MTASLEESVRLRFGLMNAPDFRVDDSIVAIVSTDRILRNPSMENSQNLTASGFGWIAMTRNSDGVSPNVVPANERWTIRSCVVFVNTIEAITYVGAGVRRGGAGGVWGPLTPSVQTSASGVSAFAGGLDVALNAGDEVGGLVYKFNAGVATFQIAYTFDREVVAA